MNEFRPDRIYMRDIRATQMCSRGARDFCARHSLSWQMLLSEGLPLEDVAATQDAMAMIIVEYVRNGR